MSVNPDAEQLLDTAEELFYERGFQSVGMAALKTASGLPLKRIYAMFSGKDAIAVAMLDRRDERWISSLTRRVDRETDPVDRVLAVFDWLADWLAHEGHRGCAWINAFGELGGTSPDVADAVRRHKNRLRDYVEELVHVAEAPQAVADAVFLLVEGSMVTAGISGDPVAATQAKYAATCLLQA